MQVNSTCTFTFDRVAYHSFDYFVLLGLVKNARLKHFKHIYSEGFSTDFRQPCVVFCGHPSLRFGDAVHFIELWGSNPLHMVIFTGELSGNIFGKRKLEFFCSLIVHRTRFPVSSSVGSVPTIGYESNLLSH